MYGPGDQNLSGILDPTFEWTQGITVLPRDPEALRRTCETLLRQVLVDPRDYGIAIDAVRRLAVIRDPVAVPFLLEAAHSDVGGYAIDGLGRIAGPEATDALRQLTTDSNPYKARQAQELLARRKLSPSLVTTTDEAATGQVTKQQWHIKVPRSEAIATQRLPKRVGQRLEPSCCRHVAPV